MRPFIILLLIVPWSTTYGQTPCLDGMAGIYPCSGFDLLFYLTLDDLDLSENGNDCWGWTDPISGREIALMGGNDRTVFIDISDPLTPLILGHLPTASTSSLWRDIKVYDDHAFIVSEAEGHGMQIFDLSRLMDEFFPPMVFDVDAEFDLFGYSHNIAINEETGYAYPVGTVLYAGGPMFINIQDPLDPQLEGGFATDGYSHDAQVIIYDGPDTDYHCQEILFAYNENSLTIVDVTDKSDPEQISTTTYDNVGYTHQGWISEDRRYIYMNDELDEQENGFNTRTLILDVSDLDAPVLADDHYGPSTAADHNLYVKGDKIYQSNYRSGLRVLEISGTDGSQLEEVGFFDNHPENDLPLFGEGTWSNYPYFESGTIVVSGYEGMFLLHSSTVIAQDLDPDLFDCTTSIDVAGTGIFSVYPNPVSSELTISFDAEFLLEQIRIKDLLGRSVLERTGMSNMVRSHTEYLDGIESGIYVLSLNNFTYGLTIIVK